MAAIVEFDKSNPDERNTMNTEYRYLTTLFREDINTLGADLKAAYREASNDGAIYPYTLVEYLDTLGGPENSAIPSLWMSRKTSLHERLSEMFMVTIQALRSEPHWNATDAFVSIRSGFIRGAEAAEQADDLECGVFAVFNFALFDAYCCVETGEVPSEQGGNVPELFSHDAFGNPYSQDSHGFTAVANIVQPVLEDGWWEHGTVTFTRCRTGEWT